LIKYSGPDTEFLKKKEEEELNFAIQMSLREFSELPKLSSTSISPSVFSSRFDEYINKSLNSSPNSSNNSYSVAELRKANLIARGILTGLDYCCYEYCVNRRRSRKAAC
jgi:hypothetical protein